MKFLRTLSIAVIAVLSGISAVSAAESGHAGYDNNPTIGNLADVNKPERGYSPDEAKLLIKQEMDLAGALLDMGNKEGAITHIERAKEIAAGDSATVDGLDGLLKDINGGSMENAKQRIAEIRGQ